MCVEQCALTPLPAFVHYCILLSLFFYYFVTDLYQNQHFFLQCLTFSVFFIVFRFLFRLINFYVVARVAKIYYHAICTIIYISRVRIHHFFIPHFDIAKVDFNQEILKSHNFCRKV